MNMNFHETLQGLLDPAPTRRREALTRIESQSPTVRDQFTRLARDLELSLRLDLAGILAGASTPELIALLAYYATSSATNLRERAIQSLRHVAGSLRQKSVTALLNAEEPATRAAACRLLAESGAQASRSELIEKLDDPVTEVAVEAIGALDILQCHDALPAIANTLMGREPAVCLAALQALVHLSTGEDLLAAPVLALLRDRSQPDAVRRSALWALGQRPVKKAEAPLLALLKTADEPASLRAAAADALKSYATTEVVTTLLELSARAPNPAVALQCRRSLGRIPERLILNVAEELLSAPDPMLRLEIAASLGGLSFPHAPNVIAKALAEERDDLVRAGLIEALGEFGDVNFWGVVRPFTAEEPLLSFPAVNALAEMMEAEQLLDFARILTEREEATIQEAVLKRLSLFGRSNGLPATLFATLLPFLNRRDKDEKIALLTLQAMEAISLPEEARTLLPLLDRFTNPEVRDQAAHTILTLAGHDAQNVLKAAEGREEDPEGYYPQAAKVFRFAATHPGIVTGSLESTLLHLAELTSRATPGAEDCAETLLSERPELILETLPGASEEVQITLLTLWTHLPSESRDRHHLPFEMLLENPSAGVRRLALGLLPGGAVEHLAEVAEIAVTSQEEALATLARRTAKRIVLHGLEG